MYTDPIDARVIALWEAICLMVMNAGILKEELELVDSDLDVV